MLLNCGVGEDSWESSRRSNQSILKEINSKHSLEGQVLKLKLQYFGHLMWRLIGLTHWKRTWCWERLKVGKEGDDRGWDGWMASPIWWTWVWAIRNWWWTGKPGVLQSMRLQRVGHDWVTALHWTELCSGLSNGRATESSSLPPSFQAKQGLRFKWFFFYICITPFTSLELVILFFWVSFYLPDCWSGILWNANSAQKKGDLRILNWPSLQWESISWFWGAWEKLLVPF